MRAAGRLSTRLSSTAWLSPSIQWRSSNTTSKGCTWLSRSRSRLTASSVSRRRCDGSSPCQAGSFTGTSRRLSTAGIAVPRAGSRVRSLPVTLSRIVRVSLALHLEVGAEQIDHGQVGGRLAIGGRRAFQDEPGVQTVGVSELPEEPRLPHARLADHT